MEEPIAVYDTDVAKMLGMDDGATDEELLGRILEIDVGRADGALLNGGRSKRWSSAR